MQKKNEIKLQSVMQDVKSMPLAKLGIFVLLGIFLFQIAVRLQHGAFQSPIDFPIPVFAGIFTGALFGAFCHINQAESRRTKHELLEKEKLLEVLKKNEQRLLLATDRSHIWDWDLVRDELYLSPGFAKNLGYTEKELRVAMQGSTANLVHPDDLEKYHASLNTHFADTSNGYLNEHRFRTKNGQYKWFLAFGHSQTDENGQVVRFAGATTDVSERVNLETQLYQAQKMEAIGNLTGGIAHDFNNLLAVTMGNLELLRDELDDVEQIRMIDAGLEATRRGADLTRSMLTFARKARLQPEVTDLNNIVRHAKNWMRSGLPTTIDIELSLLAGLWKARLDPTMLESAILNLLLNAKDAMDGSGKLTIETANVRIDQTYADSRDQEIVPGRYVMVAISDTGSGIADDVLRRIFDPFFTTKAVGQGSGMGLSMVEGFVKQSGGTVQIYSELGQGSTFKLYFPAIIDSATDQRNAGNAASITAGNGAHVLLVEDETAVRDVLAATLKAAGYQVTTAQNGDEAFAIFTSAPHFDVLVTDIVMPGTLQGTGLAKAIRDIDPELPMVFMSGYAAEATVHGNGLRLQDIRLMKPVPKHEFLTAISQATSPSDGASD